MPTRIFEKKIKVDLVLGLAEKGPLNSDFTAMDDVMNAYKNNSSSKRSQLRFFILYIFL